MVALASRIDEGCQRACEGRRALRQHIFCNDSCDERICSVPAECEDSLPGLARRRMICDDDFLLANDRRLRRLDERTNS